MNSLFSESRVTPIEILLIEDSPSDAHLTMRELKQAKIVHQFIWIDQGETAMEYLRKEGQYINARHPDLILLDLNLPGMDGREVLAAIKSDPQLRLIPVIILTTSTDEQDILKTYALNANCYVNKPVDIQHFMQTLHWLANFWLITARLPPRIP